MKQAKTKTLVIAGRVIRRGQFSSVKHYPHYKVLCEIEGIGIFYLQTLTRAGYCACSFTSIDEARAAARAEAERQRVEAGRIISACVEDICHRPIDGFIAGGPWLSSGPGSGGCCG